MRLFLAIPESRREIGITAMMADEVKKIPDLYHHDGAIFAGRARSKISREIDLPETDKKKEPLFIILIIVIFDSR